VHSLQSSASPCCDRSHHAAVCGDKDQAPTGLSAGSDEVSLAPTTPVSNVSHASPSNIGGGLPSSDSTIRGGIARSDSTNLRVLPSRSKELSLSSSDLPDMNSQASSLDEEDDERTISMVASDADAVALDADADASSTCNMLHDDPELNSLRLNSVVTS